jgi:photosystem II stability/assembly factor-like uncharacterized protein
VVLIHGTGEGLIGGTSELLLYSMAENPKKNKMKHFLTIAAIGMCSSVLFSQSLDMDYLKGMKARSIGPGGMSGRVTAIDVQRNDPEVFYVGTASGGLWKTVNGGTNFIPVFDDQEVASIGAVAIDPSNPDVVWAGTGEGNPRNSLNGGHGIYKSPDGGRTWNLQGLENTRHIHRIIVHPGNPSVVYAGAIGSPWGPHPERGVYKTSDGGRSWKQVLYVNEQTGVADMVMDPVNPEKLFVAMWEHRRWPWFFKSGGPGSGLYMTVDGGETWKRLTEKDGLPEGELGRIGLAVAGGNPGYVYALVESKKNAIYRSTDGGYTWEKRGDSNIGDRPFYYADIYVDPANENRLYSLYSRVNVSEDGGKTFETLVGDNIHSDHHAWWIHPSDPGFMIDGNDGGLAITYDRGKNWRHVTNLPVSQFYHISVDMEVPYNVYGGMQDNGSWRGPGYVWSSGGIINTYWDFLLGGDGFDVVPVPGDPIYCYAMSQQGNVRRVNLETGETVDIKPAKTGEEELRFNWNAAIAQDPFDPNTIYFGSQFVHKSEDRGDSWVVISPDLTTNDTLKQKYNRSGGLTFDVTGAENHTTILAISPSPAEKGVIWVGTDDGNIQLTTDGGGSWINCSPRIGELPSGAWIPQIVPSLKNEGEAWVVVNNYRLNDYAPYLFHTTDFGKKWSRQLDATDVQGYVLSFAQDPEEPRLQFLGTECGLFVTIDGGARWTRWTSGFPTVPTMDLVIHPREHDLVIGTFGRSAYIIDDLTPLRALARDYGKITSGGVRVLEPPVATLAESRSAPGYYFTGDAYFKGENRSPGAMISYFAAVEENIQGKKDSVTIQVLDGEMNLVRTLKSVPENGLNRITWSLDRKGVRLNFSESGSSEGMQGRRGRTAGGEPGGGGNVLPGTYNIRLSFQGDTSLTSVLVVPDPRTDYDLEGMEAKQEKADRLLQKMDALNNGMARIRECRERYQLVEKIAGKDPSEEMVAAFALVKKQLDEISGKLFRDESIQGIYYPSDALYVQLSGTGSILGGNRPLTPNQNQKLDQYMSLADGAIEMINHFLDTGWSAYREAVNREGVSLFEE